MLAVSFLRVNCRKPDNRNNSYLSPRIRNPTAMSSYSCIAVMAWCLVVTCRGSLLQQRLCHLLQPCSEVDQDSAVWACPYRGTPRPVQENECQEQSVNSEPN